MQIKKYFIILFTFFLYSCSNVNNNRKFSNSIYNNVLNKNYEEALKIAKNDDFYSNNNSRLLKFLELGTIHYLNNNYYQSLKYFEKAKKIGDELYTISLSKKVLSIWDANLDLYYGEIYELSLIRFYISLINYNIYQQGFYEEYKDKNGIIIPKKELTEKERNFHLNYARSIVIEWDSFLKTIQNEKQNEAKYKNDILAKIWGSFIHSNFYNINENQISLQLYKDANNILLKNYNMYSIFNKKNIEFNKNFNKLPKLNFQQLYKNYIEETEYSKQLQKYIKRNTKNLQKKQNDNLIVLIKDNLISPKTVKKLEIPFPITSFGPKDSELYEFARTVITTKENMPYIVIEVPEIKIDNNINKYTINVYDLNNKHIATTDLTLIEPLSYIAEKELKDKSMKIQTKITSRIITKYLAAIISSYSLYNHDDSLLKISELAAFKLSSNLINETSKTNIRYWTTLPSNIQIGGIRLKNGNYKVKVILNDIKEIYNQNIEINNNIKFIDLNF